MQKISHFKNIFMEKYDGTKESLIDGSHKPKAEHPKAHTAEEIGRIKRLLKRNPHATTNEIWYKMKRKYLYKRSITSLHRIINKLTKKDVKVINGTSKRNMTKNIIRQSK